MWIRNFGSKEVPAQLTIGEHQMFAEFLRHAELEDAIAFGTAAGTASQALTRLMASLAVDGVSFRALKKFENEQPDLLAKVSVGTLRELFPMHGQSMVCLLHVQLSALTACYIVI
jgi:hypothetical protein